VFDAQSAFSRKGNVNLQQMYLQQQFFDGALTVALGRLAPGSTFATLPVFNHYLNAGINAIPGSLNINDLTFTLSPPGVEWGSQAIYNWTQTIQVATGIYNTNPNAAAGKDNGVDLAFQQGKTGVLTV
jgi:carbohydrate-selective porin OprB